MKSLNFPGLPRVLVIDDDAGVRDGLRALLQLEGLHVDAAANIEDGVRRLGSRAVDIVFLDVALPDADGLAVLQRLRLGALPADVVVLAGQGAVSAVEAMRMGAFDVIAQPFHQDRILGVVRRCLESRQLRSEQLRLNDRLRELTSTELVGLSPAIRELQGRIDQVAAAPDTPVLVRGEGGTGRELVARCIHDRSARRHGPFVALNCAAWTESLLEAELFGHEPGVAAGSSRAGKDGYFAAAAGGTLFLDEIAEMGTSLQTKLLRALQERSIRRVGGVQDLPTDVRVIVSTRADLRALAVQGRFRDDLHHRLAALTVAVPPLHERAEDIPLLSHFFLDQIGRQMGKALTGFTAEAMETLCEYRWPGNVRELRNAIERACIVCSSGMIDEAHLPTFTGGALDGSDELQRGAMVFDAGDRSIRALESQLVAKVLDDTHWNISRAASILGINRTTLYNKIRVYRLGRRPLRGKVSV